MFIRNLGKASEAFIMRAAALLFCFASTSAFSQNAPAASQPDLTQSLKFVANGLEREFPYTRGEKQETSSSAMSFKLIRDDKDAVLSVKEVRTDEDCIFTWLSFVRLGELDPGDIHGTNQPWGIFLSVGTTDGKRVVVRGSTAESRGKIGCRGTESVADKELLLRFDDPAYRDRAIKAMRHAIELAGGKASAF